MKKEREREREKEGRKDTVSDNYLERKKNEIKKERERKKKYFGLIFQPKRRENVFLHTWGDTYKDPPLIYFKKL